MKRRDGRVTKKNLNMISWIQFCQTLQKGEHVLCFSYTYHSECAFVVRPPVYSKLEAPWQTVHLCHAACLFEWAQTIGLCVSSSYFAVKHDTSSTHSSSWLPSSYSGLETRQQNRNSSGLLFLPHASCPPPSSEKQSPREMKGGIKEMMER